MNKKHWNTVIIDSSIPNKEIFDWIDHSYELVVGGLKKSIFKKLKERSLLIIKTIITFLLHINYIA